MFKTKRAVALITTLMLVTMLFHPAALASVEKGGNVYNENDYNKLLDFFDQPSATVGFTNGSLNGFTDDPTTWAGVTWTADTEKRVNEIAWDEYGFAGSLDLSDMTSLLKVDCDSNEITSLDVTGCTALTSLFCNGNELSSLNVSSNTALTHLYCENNELSFLNISGSTSLRELRCYKNNLTVLNTSTNTSLEKLACFENGLSALDISANVALKWLQCQGNDIEALDLSTNSALQFLDCSANEISTLTLGANTTLKTLMCAGNFISTLDASTIAALDYFNTRNNPLTSLKVKLEGASLELSCNGQGYVAIDYSNGLSDFGDFQYEAYSLLSAPVNGKYAFIKWTDDLGADVTSFNFASGQTYKLVANFEMLESGVGTVTPASGSALSGKQSIVFSYTPPVGGEDVAELNLGIFFNANTGTARDYDEYLVFTLPTNVESDFTQIYDFLMDDSTATAEYKAFGAALGFVEGNKATSLANFASNIVYSEATGWTLKLDTKTLVAAQTPVAKIEFLVTFNGATTPDLWGTSDYENYPDDIKSFIYTVKPNYTITASAGAGGTISPSGATTVGYNENKTFSITPAAGYKIAAVTVNGVNKGAISSYTFENVKADGTISVTFTQVSSPIIGGSPVSTGSVADTKTGATVTGAVPSGAVLTVAELSLPAKGTNAAADAIRKEMNNEDAVVLFAKDIKLSTSFSGALTVTLPVDPKYNGQTVTILHDKNGTLETYHAVVQDGKVSFQVTSLSPFVVLLYNTRISVPNTGDSSTLRLPIGMCMLALSIAAGVFFARGRRKTRNR